MNKTADSQPPFAGNEIRLLSPDRPTVSPVDKITRGVGAELIGLGRDSGSAQVEPIGVPACLKRDVSISQAVGMQPAGIEEQLKTGVVEVKKLPSQRPGVFRPAVTVAEVAVLGHAPRVLEKGE